MSDYDDRGLYPYLKDVHEVHTNWGWFLGLGFLLILLGSLSIYFAVFVTVFSVFLLGALLVTAGAVQIVQGIWTKRWSGFFLSVLIGILYLVTGFMAIAQPALSALSLTLLIASFCFIGGLFRMFVALAHRYDHWGWLFFNGLVTFILGIMIFSDWPVSGLWLIGLFVGIDMIMLGWGWVMIAILAKKSLR